MRFASYGPFAYPEQTNANTVALFEQIASVARTLEFGVGVYIFVAQNKAGIMEPWYVGKTSRSAKHAFGARICHHLEVDKFSNQMSDPQGIAIYLVAAVDQDCQMRTANSLTVDEAVQIGDLELAFIGSAFRANPQLLNDQGKGSAPYISTQGHLDSCNTARAAIELAEILKIV